MLVYYIQVFAGTVSFCFKASYATDDVTGRVAANVWSAPTDTRKKTLVSRESAVRYVKVQNQSLFVIWAWRVEAVD